MMSFINYSAFFKILTNDFLGCFFGEAAIGIPYSLAQNSGEMSRVYFSMTEKGKSLWLRV